MLKSWQNIVDKLKQSVQVVGIEPLSRQGLHGRGEINRVHAPASICGSVVVKRSMIRRISMVQGSHPAELGLYKCNNAFLYNDLRIFYACRSGFSVMRKYCERFTSAVGNPPRR